MIKARLNLRDSETRHIFASRELGKCITAFSKWQVLYLVYKDFCSSIQISKEEKKTKEQKLRNAGYNLSVQYVQEKEYYKVCKITCFQNTKVDSAFIIPMTLIYIVTIHVHVLTFTIQHKGSQGVEKLLGSYI